MAGVQPSTVSFLHLNLKYLGSEGNASVLDAQLALLAQTLHATRTKRGLMGREGLICDEGSEIKSQLNIVLNVRNWKG